MYGCASINSAPPEQDLAAKKFEQNPLTSQSDKSTLDIETKDGELYFVWQEVKMGAFFRRLKITTCRREKR